MATITKKKVLNQASFGGTPYGNNAVLRFNLTTNSSGAYIDSNSASAITASDTVRLGVLPAGMRLDDCLAIVSDAFTATATIKLGFAYVDGVDSAAVPQDADYFYAALAMDATGRTRANNNAVAPVVLPKDAYLVIDWDAASNIVVGVADFLIYGEQLGAP